MALFHDVPKLNAVIQSRVADLSDVDGDEEIGKFLDRITDYRTELIEEDRHSDMDMHDAHEESVKGGIKLGQGIAQGKKIYVVVVHDLAIIHTLYILGINVKEVMKRIKPHLAWADEQAVRLQTAIESDD